MKSIYTLILVLMAGTAYGQSSLPACQGSDATRWSNCFGSWTGSNGEKYVGGFKDGKYNEQGTDSLANGDKYVGEFKDSKRHGQGTYFRKDGRIGLGEWFENKPSGQFTEYRADKTVVRSGIGTVYSVI